MLARVGWLAWADVAAADGVHGGRQAREKAGAADSLAALLGERRLLGHAGRDGGYTRLCRAMDQGVALPCQDRWRGRALPRQRLALLVAATSALCRATMHDAAEAFGHARAIGAVKSVSFKKKPRVSDLKLSSKKC